MVQEGPSEQPRAPHIKRAAIVVGLCGAVATLVTTLFWQRTEDADGQKPKAAIKAPEQPAEREQAAPELTPLQQKLAVLDRRVYELKRGPEPEELFRMIKEFHDLCEELLKDSSTPEEVQRKARVLREAFVLVVQVNAGPATDRDDFVGLLAEVNKDGNLDSLIAKIKAMTPEEFTAAEQKRFPTHVAVLLTRLFDALGAREKIGRDEYELIHFALYRTEGFPDDESVGALRRQIERAAEQRWLANFPPERGRAWLNARKEQVDAIVKTRKDPDARVPEIAADLQDIDDPYAKERKADLGEQQGRFDEKLRQHEQLQRALQQLVDQWKMKPGESEAVDKELQKARERRETESEPQAQPQRNMF